MVGCGKCVVYLTSPGRPTEMDYSWALRPAILVAGKGRGEMFLFFSVSSLSPLFLFLPCPVPLFHLIYYLFYLFSPFLWESTQHDSQRSLNTHSINCLFVLGFYGPVNPMGSCRARSVYLTTRLLGRLSPLSG